MRKIFLNRPRLTMWIVSAIVLMAVLGLIEPQQITVLIYKLLLVSAASVAGYWLDRSLFPYARPHSMQRRRQSTEPNAGGDCAEELNLSVHLAMLRRALVMLAVILGVALGL